ncbi:MAG: aspartate aminotransferase family protein [Lachnospiraceae bacterium]|nr:aspartate aminotransferase family protein [Lachnospiraceae bacterium]
MTKETTIEHAEQALLHTYTRYPVVFERGEGMYLYDTDGKRYLDCYAGIAVLALGHADGKYNQELKNQVDRLIHVSNLFYNVPAVEASEKLLAVSEMDRVFFTNSGTEAIEGALKAARKYRYQRTGKNDGEIIAMEHSFHGRSMGAVSVTGTEHYRTPFEPLIGGVRFATFNDLESVEHSVTDKTCAILLETVQGEGGIYPADKAFLQGIRKLCDEKDILLILDEIQCGMGRTGKMFAWQHYGVKPDIMTTAKALGCGVPVGAFLMTERVAADSLAPGDHGTTYGGNPLACAAVRTVLDIFQEREILSHVNEIAPYLEEQLDALVEAYPSIKARRGLGLMQGLEFAEGTSASEIASAAIAQGLLVITAGSNVLRIVPPLVIERAHIDEMTGILKTVLDGRKG